MKVNPYRMLKRHYGWDMGKVKRFLKWAFGSEIPSLKDTARLWNDRHRAIYEVPGGEDLGVMIVKQAILFETHEERRLNARRPK